MRQTNEACENKWGASSSGSALRNTQDETIRRSDIEVLIKLLKDNSDVSRVNSLVKDSAQEAAFGLNGAAVRDEFKMPLWAEKMYIDHEKQQRVA
ncbi:hypothetical protein F2Q68_00024447 [Brassica cretica]|uniref:Uncharacterized protein n=2 Tax=Brassica cretica TaxID=69181 RepID=A0ABQ7DQD2_BRACR|nr:hypothetical protein F2Q68_00024447 [Brassica cretica]KAF3580207.1 hypothetical protein DY000_02029459 [Brassica cretica]